MGRGNSKRAIKRMKRQGDEHKSVVEQCMFILTNAGYPIQFPWEVPHALTELINGSSGGAATSAVPSRQETLGRLAAGGQLPPPQPQQGAPRQVVRPVQSQPPRAVDPWASEQEPVDPFDGSVDGEWGDIDSSSLVDDGDAYYEAEYEDDGDELSPAEMMARYEQGQAGLMQRVAQNGVQYGRGAKGPSAGRRLVPHESVKVPKVQTPVQASPAQGEYQSPYGEAGDGPRAKNGMTRDQMVSAIERATGRAPGAPKGNPMPKPPGF